MKLQNRIAIHLVWMFVFTALTASACDICGAFIGVLPYDNQSGFGIYHRYGLYSRISSISDQPLVPSGSYRVQPTYSVLHSGHDSAGLQKGDFESYKTIELRGKWFIHNRVELNALLPFTSIRERTNSELEKISGFGDVSVWIGFHILKKLDSDLKQRLVAGVGVKLPTGNTGTEDEDGTRYHLYMQPGTGSLDETAYLQYSLGWKKYGLTMNGTVKRNGENKFAEQIEPAYTSTLNIFYMIRNGETIFVPQLQFFGEYCEGYVAHGILTDGSETGAVMGGAGCDVYFGKLGVHLTTQIPVAQIQSDENPGATFRGSLGISWNINQQNFLISK